MFYETLIEGGKHWSFTLRAGTQLRLIDREGGANVGMLFYNPQNPLERYNAPDTLKCQHTFKLTKGHCLYSDMGRIFCSIIEDSVGWHDTVCGNTNRELVAQRWGERSYQEYRNDWTQNGHDAFLVEGGKYGLGRRDLAANVNWFSKVAVGRRRRDALRSRELARRRLRRSALRDGHAGAAAHLPASLESRRRISAQPGAAAASARRAPVRGDDFCRNFRPENARGFANTELYRQCGSAETGMSLDASRTARCSPEQRRVSAAHSGR